MKIVNLSLIYLAVLGSLLFGCDKKLPGPSQEGANTFACKVNGKTWIADAKASFKGQTFSNFYSDQNKPNYMFVLSAKRINDKNNTTIMLAVSDVKVFGTQYFNLNTVSYPDDLYF